MSITEDLNTSIQKGIPEMVEKRTFKEIREIILATLAKGKNTLNNLAKEAGVNWRTTDNHLNWMKGKGLVAEVFTSDYVRIFDLTEKGRQEAEKLKQHG